MDLDEIINRLYKLPEQSRTALKANITEVTYPKGYILINAENIETNVYSDKKSTFKYTTVYGVNEF